MHCHLAHMLPVGQPSCKHRRRSQQSARCRSFHPNQHALLSQCHLTSAALCHELVPMIPRPRGNRTKNSKNGGSTRAATSHEVTSASELLTSANAPVPPTPAPAMAWPRAHGAAAANRHAHRSASLGSFMPVEDLLRTFSHTRRVLECCAVRAVCVPSVVLRIDLRMIELAMTLSFWSGNKGVITWQNAFCADI